MLDFRVLNWLLVFRRHLILLRFLLLPSFRCVKIIVICFCLNSGRNYVALHFAFTMKLTRQFACVWKSALRVSGWELVQSAAIDRIPFSSHIFVGFVAFFFNHFVCLQITAITVLCAFHSSLISCLGALSFNIKDLTNIDIKFFYILF